LAVVAYPSHVDRQVEAVASDRGRYWVVEKTGIAGAVAREMDERR
jgi:hypothetical protein